MTAFGTVEQAIEDLRNGKIVIVADDEDRENEGDFVCAAELITPETINFMTLHGRGLICLALTGERCDQLGLPQMTERNTEELATAFTVSIDAERRFGVSLAGMKLTWGAPIIPRRSRALSATLQDTRGRTLRTLRTTRSGLTVDLRGLPKGTYRARVVVRTATGKRLVRSRLYRTC